MTIVFAGLSAILIGGITLWLGRVFWRGQPKSDTTAHHDANAAVLRDQLTELERDVANQVLSHHDFLTAKQELHRRVLDEATPNTPVSRKNASNRSLAALFIMALPSAAVALYMSLGAPEAIVPELAPAPSMVTEADVQNMMKSLEERLAHNPDDPEGWLMLARSYQYFGRYNEAADAFFEAAPIIQSNPLALAEYAEVLAKSSGTGFTSNAIQLLERALIVNPEEPLALTLAGAAAFQHGSYQVAIDYWQQVFNLLPADSAVAQVVADNIEQAQARLEAAHDQTFDTPLRRKPAPNQPNE